MKAEREQAMSRLARFNRKSSGTEKPAQRSPAIAAKLDGVGRKIFLAPNAAKATAPKSAPNNQPGAAPKVNVKPILGKLDQATQMFTFWQQRGASAVASQVIAALGSAKNAATQLDAAQESRAPADRIAAIKDQLANQLKSIQKMDPDYELFSIGDMALTVKNVQKTMDPVAVTFTCGADLVPRIGEYRRLLKDSEDGINAMTCQSWLKNRDEFLARKAAGSDGRSPTGTKMQKEFNRRSGGSEKRTKAAPHNSDQVSGGHADPTGLPTDAAINSSIGGQWPKKIGTIDTAARAIPELKQLYTQMNVKLTAQPAA
jgi:hypothetical protein